MLFSTFYVASFLWRRYPQLNPHYKRQNYIISSNFHSENDKVAIAVIKQGISKAASCELMHFLLFTREVYVLTSAWILILYLYWKFLNLRVYWNSMLHGPKTGNLRLLYFLGFRMKSGFRKFLFDKEEKQVTLDLLKNEAMTVQRIES